MRKLLFVLLLSLSLKASSQDSIKIYKDTICSIKYIDSLRTELKINKFKLERIRYRIDICNKNPKLRTFFFGWVVRITKPYKK